MNLLLNSYQPIAHRTMLHPFFLIELLVPAVQSLHHINFETNSHIERNVRLINHQIAHIEPSGMLMCAKECVLYTDCKSWNFERSRLRCELNSETIDSSKSDKRGETGWYYSEQKAWKHVVQGPCENHGCQQHSKCFGLKDGEYACLQLGCDLLSNMTNEMEEFQSQGFAPVGTHITHHDIQRSIIVNATCRSEGKWNFTETSNELSCSSAPILPPLQFQKMFNTGASAAYGCPPGVSGVLSYVCDKQTGQWKFENGTCHADWCPSEFVYDIVLNICCKLFNDLVSQSFASNDCGLQSADHLSQHGHLITIDSQERQKFVKGYLLSLNNTAPRVWIDGKRDNQHAPLKTNKGLRFLGYDNIADRSSQGNCLQIDPMDNDFSWRYSNCSSAAWYLCEIVNH